MIALKTFRDDLGEHIAAAVNAANAKHGAQVNPPAVVVRPSGQYVQALDYCTDIITFDVVIVAPLGDPPGIADALDDMLDLIRSTCRNPSAGGHKYKFGGVSGLEPFNNGELPQAVATISVERYTP